MKYKNSLGLEFRVMDTYSVKGRVYCIVKFTKSGWITKVYKENAIKGKVKDVMSPIVCGVGYLGSKIKYSISEYRVWHNMIYRCYSGLDRYRSYVEVTVCDRWQNFTNFLEDCRAKPNAFKKGYDMDKDGIGDGLLYSNDTVQFITRSENLKLPQKERRTGYWLALRGGQTITAKTAKRLAEKIDCSHCNVVQARLKKRPIKGWTIKKINL